MLKAISYKRRRNPATVIQLAVRMYFRFSLSAMESGRDGLLDRRRTHIPLARLDDDGVVLVLVVQKRRDTGAVLHLLSRLLRNQGATHETIATDGLKSYASALELGLENRHRPGRLRENNRAENSHLPIRRCERTNLPSPGGLCLDAAVAGSRDRPADCFALRKLMWQSHAGRNPQSVLYPTHLLTGQALRILRARSESAWSRVAV